MKKDAVTFERIKVGFSQIGKGKIVKKKNDTDYKLKMADGRELVLPKEKIQGAEILELPKAVKIKKGITLLFPVENGQLTHFNGSLTEQTNPLLDSESVSAVVERGSLRVIARLSGILSGGYMMYALLAAAGLAGGYIMYPLFNHPAPVIEYCNHFANGTLGSCSLFP